MSEPPSKAVALVTGAGSGIGRATALLLASRGMRVVAADISAETAEETANLGGDMVTGVEIDVADEQSVESLCARCDRELGSLRLLANVAGIGSTTTAPNTPIDVWERVFSVNVRGTFLTCKHAIPRMARSGGGSIVNVASVAGLVGLRNRAAYCASKGAVIALTRALSVDHVADGIRVNCLCPGTIDSPWVRRLVEEVGESMDSLVSRQPLGRLGTPQEIAEAIIYIASAEFMSGSVVVVDGGLTAA